MIRFSLDKNTLYLHIRADVHSSRLTASALEKAFRASEFNQCKLDDDVWAGVPQRFDQEAGNNPPDEFVAISVGQKKDAELEFRISDDKMEADVTVHAPCGGQTLSTEQVLNKLRNAGITNGIKKEAIQQIVAHSREAPPGSDFTTVIARGRQPRNGKNTSFKPLVEDARTRILRPQAKDEHRVDMRDLGQVISVGIGTPVLKRVPLTMGRPGFNVLGEEIPAQDGEDKELKVGDGTEISPSDSNILIATRTGLPSFTDNSATIDEVLTMQGVDVSTGHVDFDGSVIVEGNVTPGMRVTARGDITINGYVDSATVRAGGNITVTKGVIGQQRDPEELEADGAYPGHSTRIIADSTIWVAYCQYATLIARDSVFVEKQITHCQIITPGTSHIGGEAKAAMGKVIGGELELGGDLFVGQLGAPAGTRTRIIFSVPATSDEQEEEIRKQTSILSELVIVKRKLMKAKERFLENPKNFKAGYRQALQREIQRIQHEMIIARNKVVMVREQKPQQKPIRIHVNKVIHSGAEFRFHDKIRRMTENRGPTVVALIDGQIVFET
ncbi:MAG: DUF342 domain-containing protein [Idiomarina sp.]|nr:DUF342 domain-containing protein [Idiomarina sp.]